MITLKDKAMSNSKKMRVQLLDENLVPISDRLVVQDTEFMVGPKEVHKGAMRIEFNLHTQDDVSKCKAYLDKLMGDIPLAAKKTGAGRPSKSAVSQEVDFSASISQLLNECKTQDELMAGLREAGFTFLSSQYIDQLKESGKIKWNWKDEKHQSYQFMVPQLKRAKNPMSDRYDFTVAVGFKLTKETPGILIYELGSLEKRVKIGWKVFSAPRLKKAGMTVFPKFMTDEDRDRYRLIERKNLEKIELTKPESKFFERWDEWVKKPAK